jgi:hypothetical protein
MMADQVTSSAIQAEDFYVGYSPKAPARTARFVRLAVLASLAIVVLCSLVAATTQPPVDSGVFEFGQVKKYSGYLQVDPVPALRLAESGDASAWALLVGFGKFGISDAMRAHHGKLVEFEGTAIYRRGMMMVEVTNEESFRVLGEAPKELIPAPVEQLGKVELVGELVDSKCFLGVMRPATGKVHRACAIRCLSGGAPAALWVRGETANDEVVVLLAAKDGSRPSFPVQWAGLPLRATGSLEKHAGFAVLRVENLLPIRSSGAAPR